MIKEELQTRGTAMPEKTDKSKTKKLKHVKIYDQLYEQIKDGTYQPESQLPPETTLAASMNVSRMTLRKALMLLIEDGLVKNVPGVGNFIRATRSSLPSSMAIASKANHTLHPVHAYCTESLDDVEVDSRIEIPSKSILDSFGQYTAAVVITDRWYRHAQQTIAYSLSFIPIEVIGKLKIDLKDQAQLLEFLEHTSYNEDHHFYRSCTYSTSGNFTAKNYTLSSQDSFLLVLENIYDKEHQLLMTNKHYIPWDLFRIELYI